MKKRILTLGMILLLSLTVCACEKKNEPSAYDMYVGDYQDSFSQRATARVDLAKEDGIKITIDWSDSAFAYCEWVMTAKLNDGKLEYTDMKEKHFGEWIELKEKLHFSKSLPKNFFSGFFIITLSIIS